MKSVIPWSWSSYEAYQTCPRKFYEIKIAKNWPDPPGEAALWGNAVHKAIEDYLNEQVPVPATMRRFIPIVDRIANAPGDTYVEHQLACDINLNPVDFEAPNAWCRGIGDLIKINKRKGLNADWKTGKWKEASLQLDLAGVMTFAKFPELEQITTLFMYFQLPSKPVTKVFHREDIPAIMAQFEQGVADMTWSEQNNVWPEKPSGLCKAHCPVRECKYWGRGNRRW